ncbi:MAG: alpha/beta hydrolase family esterase [Flavobacteriales bacterium]
MQFRFCSLLVMVLFSCSLEAKLYELKGFGSNPGNLRAFLHSPINFSDTNGAPLVVVLHGCNQNAHAIFDEAGWEILSDKLGVYVLCPEQKLLNNGMRCFNWFLSADNSADRGELGSILQMINYTISLKGINKKKIFIYGVSAGGYMSVACMANHPELFRSGAILAGGPYFGPATIAPGKKLSANQLAQRVFDLFPVAAPIFPSMLILHGTKDPVVDYSNAELLFEQWSLLHGLPLSPPSDTIVERDNTFYRKQNFNKDSLLLVELLALNGLGHYLPVDPGNGVEQGGKKGLFAKDKNWFSTLYVVRFFGLLH